MESFRWEPCWKAAHSGTWVMARTRGSPGTWGKWGFDQSLLMMHFWPHSLAELCQSQFWRGRVLLPLPGAPETCLGAARCHGNVCVLVVPAEGWRIPDFCHYFRADSITGWAAGPSVQPNPWNSGCWVCPSVAVPSNFFSKQLYLNIKIIIKKKVVNGSDRYLLLLLSNTGLIVFCP